MTPDERTEFAISIGAMAEAFHKKITADTIRAYGLVLEDLPIEAIERAVFQAMRSCRFFPSPAELREMAGEITPEQRALRAWDVLLWTNNLHQASGVDFCDDLVLNATVRNLGGWVHFGRLKPAERNKWYRKDFMQTYQAMMKYRLDPRQTAALENREKENDVYIKKIRTGLSQEQLRFPAELPKLLEDVRPTFKKA